MEIDKTQVKILLVDDEPDILEFLSYELNKKGYQVYTASNGISAIEVALSEVPHVMILDLMMPDMDGIEVCQKIRSHEELNSVMISFLTARTEDYIEVATLDAGADNFITKPVKIRTLNSHINALVRRHSDFKDKQKRKVIEIDNLLIDKDSYELFSKGEKIDVSLKEFQILWILAKKPGKVRLREDIYRKVWGAEVIVGERTLDVHISKLRDKIGKERILTVKGIGYKLVV